MASDGTPGGDQDRLSQLSPRDAIVFDLDGTLWDTCAACAVGWNNVIARHGIAFRPITDRDVRSVTGRPHEACIRDVFIGVPEAELRLLIDETQSEDIRMIEQLGGELYRGVGEGVQRLGERYPLFIVSNCQAGYIEMFLALSGLASWFRDHECWGNTGLSKSANLARVIERNRLRSPLFIGDAEGDQQAAEACNVPFVHASYGFGDSVAPFAVIEAFDQLVTALCR